MHKHLVSKKKAKAICGALFLVGLAISFTGACARHHARRRHSLALRQFFLKDTTRAVSPPSLLVFHHRYLQILSVFFPLSSVGAIISSSANIL
jgi:hypothetical protein